jgi:hypothetical protein
MAVALSPAMLTALTVSVTKQAVGIKHKDNSYYQFCTCTICECHCTICEHALPERKQQTVPPAYIVMVTA